MHAVELWAGEAGGTGGGGSDNVTNSFASIWYLDSLGLYAATGTSVFARQDLVGGFYGFLEDGCPFAGWTLEHRSVHSTSRCLTLTTGLQCSGNESWVSGCWTRAYARQAGKARMDLRGRGSVLTLTVPRGLGVS